MFEKRQETFFASRQINEKAPLKIEIIEGINVVSLKSERDHILIPLTNVSAVYLKSPIKKEQEIRDSIERQGKTVIAEPKVKRR
tara:strand:- start:232 stop:483 length:252 start_codon:yes stop_codon:yes gene_type:complete